MWLCPCLPLEIASRAEELAWVAQGKPEEGQKRFTGRHVRKMMAHVWQRAACVREHGPLFAGHGVSKPPREPAEDEVVGPFGTDLATTLKNFMSMATPYFYIPLILALHFPHALQIQHSPTRLPHGLAAATIAVGIFDIGGNAHTNVPTNVRAH